MTAPAHEILAAVRACGGDVRVIGPDRLRIVGPLPLLPRLVEQVRAVKSELLAVLADAEARVGHPPAANPPAPGISWGPDDWRVSYHVRAAWRRRLGHSEVEATRLAWGELQCRWHRLHGERTPAWRCAGCDEPMGSDPALLLPDATRVHIGKIDCLTAYGQRWRAGATRALTAMGLAPPPAEGVP